MGMSGVHPIVQMQCAVRIPYVAVLGMNGKLGLKLQSLSHSGYKDVASIGIQRWYTMNNSEYSVPCSCLSGSGGWI